MSSIEILTRWTTNAHNRLNQLLDAIPLEKWNILPSVIETNVSWQVGHLILSQYYYTVQLLVGLDQSMLNHPFYKSWMQTDGTPRGIIGPVNPLDLQQAMLEIQALSISTIKSIPSSDLGTKLDTPNVATKLEAISWNSQHIIWHCGQIGLLKRVLKHMDQLPANNS